MTAIGLQRRLVFCFLAVSSLLGIYILCLSLEIRVPWRMVDLTRFHDISYTQGPIRSQDSEEPLGSNGAQSTPDSAIHPKLLSGHERTNTAQTATVKSQRASATAAEPAKGKARPLSGDVAESNGKPGGKGGTGTTTKGPNLPPRLPTHPVEATEPPYIGDTYTSENIPLQTDCPSSIRKKVPATEFDGRFLRDIPVLQWAKHATPDQYKRLSRYPGAHGWGGIDYETLAASLSILNSSANWLMFDDWTPGNKTCIRCAVVGNGGILKNSKRGQEIDRHDYILRTNGAVIKGFEEDVGSRTTHYTFSTNTLRNSMRSYAGLGYRGPPVSKETRYVFLPDHDRDYLLMKASATHTPVARGPERSNSPPNYFGANVSAEKFKMYHPDFIRYLRNRFLRSHALKTRYKDIYRPSTGAVMLLAAMHTCDQVSAYGFMTPDYSSYSDHYYDNVYRPVGFFINHDLRMEMNLWQQLHHAGLIQLYMHQ